MGLSAALQTAVQVTKSISPAGLILSLSCNPHPEHLLISKILLNLGGVHQAFHQKLELIYEEGFEQLPVLLSPHQDCLCNQSTSEDRR